MRVVKTLKNGKVVEVIEVTKLELNVLDSHVDYISISNADINTLKDIDDDTVVGYIAGDISNVVQDNQLSFETTNEVSNNPDCWFVYKPENHGYKTNGKLDFGDAISLLKLGYKVARNGWNGKGMFLFLVPGSKFKVNRPPLLGIYEEGTEISYHAHIDMKTATGDIVPWLASQTDMLAEDWCIVE